MGDLGLHLPALPCRAHSPPARGGGRHSGHQGWSGRPGTALRPPDGQRQSGPSTKEETDVTARVSFLMLPLEAEGSRGSSALRLRCRRKERSPERCFPHPSTVTRSAGYRNGETLTQPEAKCPPSISSWVNPDQLSAWSQASASLRCLLSAVPHVGLESSGP